MCYKSEILEVVESKKGLTGHIIPELHNQEKPALKISSLGYGGHQL